ncbi:dihydroxyacetone kinase subunit M [Escherichia coli]|nr:dihydroxyacetone kinase subunit M [Escherichia coli]
MIRNCWRRASELLQHEHCTAEYAGSKFLKNLASQYQQLDDEYLQARYIDVDDLLHRTLVHLTQTKEELPQFNSPTILLAENIYPSTSTATGSGGCKRYLP